MRVNSATKHKARFVCDMIVSCVIKAARLSEIDSR